MDFVKQTFVKKGEASDRPQPKAKPEKPSTMEEQQASMHYFAPSGVRNRHIDKRVRESGGE